MDVYVKFTKTMHQVWSCHVILASNSENFYFLPNYDILGKVTRFGGQLAQYQKSYRQKTNWGWKRPPSDIGLKRGGVGKGRNGS